MKRLSDQYFHYADKVLLRVSVSDLYFYSGDSLLTFESVDEIQKCEHSIKPLASDRGFSWEYSALLSEQHFPVVLFLVQRWIYLL